MSELGALKPLSENLKFRPRSGPVVFIVLDGVGIGRKDEGDAVHLARTPTLDWLDSAAMRTELNAHGTFVGLPSDKDMGNSEVGHNAIGAGRVFDQGAKLVNAAIDSGQLFETPEWLASVERATQGGTLHFMGLHSDGNVHSHINHLHAMLQGAHRAGVARVRLHMLSDGRDVGEHSALIYIDATEAVLAEINAESDRDYRIASGGGRMITTMDRYEADWSIVERGWKAHVLGEARAFASARQAIETLRDDHPERNDQTLPSWVIVDDDERAVGTIEDGDAVIFFNFRGDRAIEITRAFTEEGFSKFDRVRVPDVYYAGMMLYDGDLGLPRNYLVNPPSIDRTMGEYMANAGQRTLAISETQKYGHVTYFWNGNRSGYFDASLETYIEVPSDRVEFNERPWMKAAEITDATLAHLAENPCDFVRINYANGDMVGHTGDLQATIISVEAVDLCLARLIRAIEKLNGVVIVTADHGNADEMFMIDKKTKGFQVDEDGDIVPKTSHTLNAVPFWIYDPAADDTVAFNTAIEAPGLANIAATLFNYLGFEAPEGYEPSLVTLR